ncbi:hypothetical protein LTR53_018644, partial [Teratosphaeriaceae sp. CCFEE 6253]
MPPNGIPPNQFPHPQHIMSPMGPPPQQQPFDRRGYAYQPNSMNAMPYNMNQTPQHVGYMHAPPPLQQPMPGYAPHPSAPRNVAVHGHGQSAAVIAPTKASRKKKGSPQPVAPPSPGSIPPYDARDRPTERKKATKVGRKNL